MRKSVVRLFAFISLTACTLSGVTGCKKKSAFPEEDAFTTYTIPIEERNTTDPVLLFFDEATSNLHDVPDDFTFLPAKDEELIEHYSCSSDNMFGLKEIYVYENTVVTIFDQETFDSIDTLYNFDRNPTWTEGVWEEDYYKEAVAREFKDSHTDGWATAVSGKDRICIVKIFYSEERKKEIEEEPWRYLGRGFISILGREIDFNDGDISLYYREEFNYDFTREHRQTYNSKTGKWSDDKLNEYSWE